MKILKPNNSASRLVLMADTYRNKEEYRKAVGDAVLLILGARYKLAVYTELGAEEQTIIDYTDDFEYSETDVCIVMDEEEFDN